VVTPTPSPSVLLPPGPTGPGPSIFLILLVAGSAYLWWRVRKELRRVPQGEEDDVA
jgi:hypothetical protein